MKYSKLGGTGVQVSRIGLGSATFGVAPDRGMAERIVARALDLGVNLFDCANSYGNQARFDRPGAPPADQRESAEEILGRALKGRRDEVLVCSKVMEPVGNGPNDRGLSRVHIFNQVERSLHRLGTDHLDIYYAHHPEPSTRLDETARAFDDLIRQGKVRYWALSTYQASEMMEALWTSERHNLHRPVCNQIPYNLAYRGAAKDLLPACARHDVSVTVFSPLAGGLLAGPAGQREFSGHKRWGGPGFTDQELKLAGALQGVAERRGYTPASLAIAWLVAQPAVCAAIVGPESLEELEVNAQGADLQLPDDVMAEVAAIGATYTTVWH
jgi:aryl-alcohol dehydrogenase-like predicted oxidoreductase